ncbi:MAG: DUF1189 family protein [Candidatus Omnitrophica bacterium]|nr:DUF1189 family protein [Candidatus Omnitrophota bacterium]
MRIIDFIVSPVLSLFSSRFYRSVLKSSLGWGFLYAIYLSAICAATFFLVILFKWVPLVDDFVDWFSVKMPAITIDQKGISSSVSQPYKMKHPTYGMILILNATEKDASTEEAKDAVFYVTKTKIYANDPVRNETRVVDLFSRINQPNTMVQPQTITGKLVRDFYQKVRPYFLTTLFLLIMAFILLWKIAAAFIYSVIAVILNRFREEKFHYAALLNLSFFALTTVTLLQFLSLATPDLNLALPLWMSLLITTIYLGYATLVASPPEKSN